MLEAVDHVAQEAEANIGLYRMLAAALRTLAEDPVPAVSAAFFWKLLALEGVQPVLVRLRPLRRAGHGAATFDVGEGGVLCRACAGPGAPTVPAAGLALVEPDPRRGPAGSPGRTARPGPGRGGIAGPAGPRASPGTAPTEHSHASGYHSWSCPPRLNPTIQA